MSEEGPVPGPAQVVPPQNSKPAWKDWRVWIIVGLAVISIPTYRAVRVKAAVRAATEAGSTPTVAVDRVRREDVTQDLVCEAELRPFQEIDVHAKVAGYVVTLPVDIGDQVTNGQLLAQLEIPELQDELEGARAAHKRNIEDVSRCEASYDDAHLVYQRLARVRETDAALVAAQDLDSAHAKDLAAASTLSAAKAQVEVSNAELNRLRTLVDYSRITAPFPGVITKRYADTGALIQAGTSSSTQTLPVVRLSQNDLLRLSIPLSVSYVSKVHTGDPVEIRVDAMGVALTGRIARTSGKVDAGTKTMETEVDVPNKDLKLIPGVWAVARLRLDHRDKVLTVPVLAVSREEPYSVFVVDKESKIEERKIKVGLETAERFEVLDGVRENDLVLVGNRAQVRPGQRVKPEQVSELRGDL
jgi:RND family efflux transporter MFP subunit